MKLTQTLKHIGNGLAAGSLVPAVLFVIAASLGVTANFFGPVDQSVLGQVALTLTGVSFIGMIGGFMLQLIALPILQEADHRERCEMYARMQQ